MQSGFWPEQVRGLLEKLGIEHPIIQAPMAGGPSTPKLVAAVSNAGALGSLGVGYLTPAQIDSEIRKVKELTKQPFSVNLFIPEVNNADTPSDKVIKKLVGFSKDSTFDVITRKRLSGKRYFYPASIEYGTKHISARPFIRPAWDTTKNAALNKKPRFNKEKIQRGRQIYIIIFYYNQ